MPPNPADFDDDYTVDDKSYNSTNKQQINRLHASKLTITSSADNRKYMSIILLVYLLYLQQDQIMPLIVKNTDLILE